MSIVEEQLTVVETKSTELDVASAGADSSNSCGSSLGKFCIGSGTSEFELPLLSNLNTFTSGSPMLMSAISTDTHVGNCGSTLKPVHRKKKKDNSQRTNKKPNL